MFSVSDYQGKYLVIVFYQADWDSNTVNTLRAFSKIKSKFTNINCDLVACSTDSPKVHKCWVNSDADDEGFDGKLDIALWSDPSGHFADKFDLFEEEESQCLNGVVVIDDAGVVRHAMTTSLEDQDIADNCLQLVKLLKVYKEDETPKKKAAVTPSMEKVFLLFMTPVMAFILCHLVTFQDWDISRDPELIKALEVAKRLGQKQPAHMVYRPKNPSFDLPITRIRRMVNPRAGVHSCSAAVYRNLAGFGCGRGEFSVQDIV